MLPDHYATLGIAPSSRPAAVRAAYLALMSRYHPDRNPSAVGAVRVRAITAAYAVLGAPDRRAAYDLERARLVAAEGSGIMPERPQWWLMPLIAVFFGIVVIVLLLPLLIPPPLVPPERSGPISSVGGRQQAAPLEQDQTVAGGNSGTLCSSPAAAGLIKRELFRRAAGLRGSDRAAYDRLADFSIIRMASPPLANTESGIVSCNASVAIDLPPGVTTPGGRRILVANIAYSMRATDGATDMVSLSGEEAIVTPLAGAAQMARQATDRLDAPAAPETGARIEQAEVLKQTSPPVPPPEAAAARAQAIQRRPQPPQPRPAAGAGQAPAWQQPLKPAWQQPLPPAND